MSDNFADAQWLTGTSISGNNSTATGEDGEPDRTYHSVWFKWTASASSGQNPVYQFDTNGSDFDTYLYIYIGTSLDNLNLLDSDDDGGEGSNSEITLDIGSLVGVTCYIKITGYGEDDFGNYVLNYPLAGIPDPRPPIVSVTEEPPYPITRESDYEQNPPIGTKQSYIEVWRSFGGPAPFDLSVPNAIEAAKDYVLRGGTPPGNLDFQWWSKRPPGDQEWRGGPGAIDPPDGSLLIESNSWGHVVGQSGTHSISEGLLGFSAEIKYGISTYTVKFYMGRYLYISPNSNYNVNYWEQSWGGSEWSPGQPTPPEHYERQVPATIPAELLGATLYVGGEAHGTTLPIVNIFVGDQLAGKYQNNYYSDSITGSPFYTGTVSTGYPAANTEINLTADFILNNMDSLGNLAFTFIDSDTLAGNFTCEPGTPVLGGVQYLNVNKQQDIYATLDLHFMSPTYNHFTFRYGTPPLRLAQRDDQEGLSPTARLDLSPSTSYQKNNSSRIYGGLYL